MTFSKAWHDITIPGVQNPHCSASCATNAAWMGASCSPPASPSIVVTGLPTASSARTVQEGTGWSPSITVHAPQAPRSQPVLVPVSPRPSRSASTSVVRGSTLRRCGSPLTFSSMSTAPGPNRFASPFAAVSIASPSSAAHPVSTPAPLTNPRRVNFVSSGMRTSGWGPRA